DADRASRGGADHLRRVPERRRRRDLPHPEPGAVGLAAVLRGVSGDGRGDADGDVGGVREPGRMDGGLGDPGVRPRGAASLAARRGGAGCRALADLHRAGRLKVAEWRFARGWTEAELEDRLARLADAELNFDPTAIGPGKGWTFYYSEAPIGRGTMGPPDEAHATTGPAAT